MDCGQHRNSNLLHSLDALPGATAVRVLVFLAGGEVVYSHPLDVHVVRSSFVVNLAASPFDSTYRVLRIACRPDTQSDVHRGLGECRSVGSIIVGQRPLELPVNPPLQLLVCPVRGIVVEAGCSAAVDLVEFRTTISSDALAVVVGLNMGGVVSHPLPINLIQIVRLQDHTADDTSTWGGLHDGLDNAAEDVEVGLDRRRLQSFGDRKLCTFVRVINGTVCDIPNLVVKRRCEIEGGIGTQSWIRGTGHVQRVTVRPGLRRNGGDAGGQEAEKEKERHGRINIALYIEN